MKKLITSESVTEGHPDKVCDRISDSVLDEILRQDPNSRVACETCVTTGFVLVMGEISTTGYADVEKIARAAIKDIGYTEAGLGFDSESCSVLTMIHGQSADIAQGVNKALEAREENSKEDYDSVGAGDQGMMYGYATDETDEYMPLPIYLAHRLTRQLARARKRGDISYLKPDGKSQVTVEYENGIAKRVDTIVISTQHADNVDQKKIHKDILEKVIRKVIDPKFIDKSTKIYINPTGKFVIGGPAGDSGLTGRKIIVDTYGGICPHGGGAFSGKDPTKVDRSACYMARYACKNIVAAGLAKRCELQVSYAIGKAKPVSMYIDTFNTGIMEDEKLARVIERVFDFRPAAIIKQLDLKKPIYAKTSAYGHFGNPEFSWEKLDKVEVLKSYAKNT